MVATAILSFMLASPPFLFLAWIVEGDARECSSPKLFLTLAAAGFFGTLYTGILWGTPYVWFLFGGGYVVLKVLFEK